MDIGVDYKKLFDYNVDGLRTLVQGLTATAWLENDIRQKKFDVHRNTESIVYVWSRFMDPNYDDVQVQIPEANDNPLHAEVWKIGHKIRDCYGPQARITKLMLAKLKGFAVIKPHTDLGNLEKIHRCHLPVISNDNCFFFISRIPYVFKPNTAFEFNNQREHAVNNQSPEDRVHLICDILD
jgi:hypothetical protein